MEAVQHSQHLLNSLHQLYSSGQLTDIVLKCGESSFNVHCVVLVAFSSVFEALLCTNFRNGIPNDTCLELQTLSSDQLEIVLGYLYTGNLQCSEQDARALLKVADTLGIKLLQAQLKTLVGDEEDEAEVEEEEEEEEAAKEEAPKELEEVHESCDSCDFTADNSRSMLMHMIGVHGVKVPRKIKEQGSYTCNECDFKTRYYTSLRRHKMRHQGHFPYACERCEYATNDATSLKKHMRRHTGQPAPSEIFTCPQCSVTFSSKTGLTRHSWKHSGFMPYQCDVCDQRFSNRECFIEHRFEHDGIKPYGCHVCAFECAKRPLLKAHHLTEHDIRYHAIEPRCNMLGTDTDLKAKRFIKVNRREDKASVDLMMNTQQQILICSDDATGKHEMDASQA